MSPPPSSPPPLRQPRPFFLIPFAYHYPCPFLHVVHKGVPKQFPWTKILGIQLFENLSEPPFFCRSASVHFCNTFCQKCSPFSTAQQPENLSGFFVHYNFFHPYLTNANYLCRRIFGTSLFNPSRQASGFTREGGRRGRTDNEPIAPILLLLVPEFINIEFHILQFLHF